MHALTEARVALVEILLLLNLLVLLVASLALVFRVLLRQRWPSLTGNAAELSRLT